MMIAASITEEPDHWSSPNGCHPDCPACTREVQPPARVESFWIDVRDHLPDDDITVLIATGPDDEGDHEVTMAFRDAGVWRNSISLKQYPIVEAWMDVPEARQR